MSADTQFDASLCNFSEEDGVRFRINVLLNRWHEVELLICD